MSQDSRDCGLPLGKARRWIAALERGIGDLDPSVGHAIMARAATSCSQDLWQRCAQVLGHEPSSAEDLIVAWNAVRKECRMDAHGQWSLDQDGQGARAEFSQCGCPLVTASMVQLQPQHCLCSQAMIEAIFSRAVGRPVQAVLGSAIGRGDETCRFLVTWPS